MTVIAANINYDNQTAAIATSEGIKVMAWKDIKLSSLIDFREDNTAPSGYKAWSKFHKENPWVMPLIIKLAMELKNSGATKWSIRGIFWEIKKNHQLKFKGDGSRFRLNNNYSSFYSRAVMAVEPELFGFFDIREKKGTSL